MEIKNFRFYKFGEFKLDARRRILLKNNEQVQLSARIFDLLLVFLQNEGKVLGHEQLLDKVWEGTFVEQSNLKKTVSALRHTLGASPESSEFITTVPRRGYRFTAPVRPLSDETILIRETHAEILVEEEIEDRSDIALLPQTVSERKITHRFHSRQIIFVGGAILFLTIAAFAFWKFWQTPPQRFSAENARISRLMGEGNIGGGFFSADGNFFVYTVAEGRQTSLWVRQSTTGSAVQIVPPLNGSFWALTFAPDGSYVYYTLNHRDEPAKSGVYRVPALGSFPPQLIINQNYLNLKFSPDGISPLYAVKKEGVNEKASFYVAEILPSGGAENILIPSQERIISVVNWMSDKNSFLLLQRELHSELFQIWQYFPASGEMTRVTNDNYIYSNLTLLRDGKSLGTIRIFALGSIWRTENSQDDFRQIASGYFFSLEWTADGRLVFSETENGKEFVGIMNADGTQKRFLTNGADGIRPFPNISGDGKQIGFISDRSGNRQVWRIDADGRNPVQLTKAESVGESKILSDGQTVIYTAYLKSGTWSLLKQTADGSTQTLFDGDTHEWDISPDEKYLAIQTMDTKTGKKRLFVLEIESGREIKSFDNDNVWCLKWTHDGQALTFVRINDNFQEIVFMPLAGSPERVLTTVHSEQISNFDWSLDGTRLALVRAKIQNEVVLIQSDEKR